MIPTAEEFHNNYDPKDATYIDKMLIAFAKAHVESALKAISNSYMDDLTEWNGNPYTGEGADYLSEKKINSMYPLTNIQ